MLRMYFRSLVTYISVYKLIWRSKTKPCGGKPGEAYNKQLRTFTCCVLLSFCVHTFLPSQWRCTLIETRSTVTSLDQKYWTESLLSFMETQNINIATTCTLPKLDQYRKLFGLIWETLNCAIASKKLNILVLVRVH